MREKNLGLIANPVFRVHLAIIAFLTLLHSIIYIAFPDNRFGFRGLLSILDMQHEQSVGTFFSALGLLVAAFCAATIAAIHRQPDRRLMLAWVFVALCLAFMAIDEACAFHDRLADAGQRLLGSQGAFLIGWTLPYLILVALVGAVGLVLLRAVPLQTRIRLIWAGGLYVLFALGFEMVQGLLLQQHAGDGSGFADAMKLGPPPYWNLTVTIEEAGEMVAVALAIRAMLLHMGDDLRLAVTVRRQA